MVIKHPTYMAWNQEKVWIMLQLRLQCLNAQHFDAGGFGHVVAYGICSV